MTDLKKLFDAIVEGNLEESVQLTKNALSENTDPQLIINEYLVPAMDKVGDMFEKCEAFVPELLLAARAMKGSLGFIQPLLSEGVSDRAHRVILGTVQGDLHDIGKNLVASMLEGAGFKVIDLGNDVSPQKFVEAIKRYKPELVGMSALLTTTMTAMESTIKLINEEGLRSEIKIIVGGAPLTQNFSKKIGADGFSDNANGAVRLARSLV